MVGLNGICDSLTSRASIRIVTAGLIPLLFVFEFSEIPVPPDVEPHCAYGADTVVQPGKRLIAERGILFVLYSLRILNESAT